MTKAEKIYPELKKMITELSPGSRIPSVRVMMKKFHVSQSTIDQAMGKFKDEGLVVTYVGDGTYTKGYNEKKESKKGEKKSAKRSKGKKIKGRN